MQAELYDLWLIALESGEWNQTTGWLVSRDRKINKDGYCCLGVLARCSGLEDEDIHGHCSLDSIRTFGDPLIGDLTLCQETELIDLNDQKLWSFKQIAGWVKQNIKREAEGEYKVVRR